MMIMNYYNVLVIIQLCDRSSQYSMPSQNLQVSILANTTTYSSKIKCCRHLCMTLSSCSQFRGLNYVQVLHYGDLDLIVVLKPHFGGLLFIKR